MSINPPEVFLNENGTQVYLRECKHHGLTEYYYITKRCFLCKKNDKNKNKSKENEQKQIKRNTKTQQIVDYMGGCCIVCGYNKSNYAMECHHTDPTQKEHTISQLKYKKWETILKEIEKCVLVCSNCHRDIHTNKTPKNKYRHINKMFLFKLHNEKCFICDTNNIYHMSYHHIDPSTKCFTISDGITKGYKMVDIIKESSKCVLLCDNCHREYHSGYFHQNINFISTFNNKLYQKYLLEEEKKKEPKNICEQCGKKTNNERFCSNDCRKVNPIPNKRKEKKEPKNICEQCGEKTNNKRFCSQECNNLYKTKNNPTKEELQELIKIYTLKDIGKMFDVSISAVKKWVDKTK